MVSLRAERSSPGCKRRRISALLDRQPLDRCELANTLADLDAGSEKPGHSWVEDCWSVLNSSWKSRQARVTQPRHPTNDDAENREKKRSKPSSKLRYDSPTISVTRASQLFDAHSADGVH